MMTSQISRMLIVHDLNSTLISNAFTQTQPFLMIKVNRLLQWIQLPSYFVTDDVIPSGVTSFPLSFRHMFSDSNLHQLGESFNQFLHNNSIPQDFWGEFSSTLSDGIKSMGHFAIVTKHRVVTLFVELDVVRVEQYDEQRYLSHVLSLRSTRGGQFDGLMPASKESVDSLETMTFKRFGNGSTGDEEMVDASCSICLDEYNDGEHIKKMPCSHSFHSGCVETWLNKMNTCPLCRFQII